MHRFIFVLAFCCSNAIANGPQKTCNSWEDIARAAMTARQAGVPLKTMLMLVSDETAVGFFKAAYDYPRQQSASDQQDTIGRFVDLVLSECLKSRSG